MHFEVADRWVDYRALVAGEIDDRGIPVFHDTNRILLRIDSGCLTGQLYGDLTCDCREQLQVAMEMIQRAGEGVIVSIPSQDGRGMGLDFKLTTLLVQELFNLDTCAAAKLLSCGHEIDQRDYLGVIAVLGFLGIPSGGQVRLMTNNPRKLEVLRENGFRLLERLALEIPATEHTQRHLEAKRRVFGHLI
jgi:GTP cyclohydrolase II